MVWPTLGSRTTKDQIRDTCVNCWQASVAECRGGGVAGSRQHSNGRRHSDPAGSQLQRPAVSPAPPRHQLERVDTQGSLLDYIQHHRWQPATDSGS